LPSPSSTPIFETYLLIPEKNFPKFLDNCLEQYFLKWCFYIFVPPYNI